MPGLMAALALLALGAASGPTTTSPPAAESAAVSSTTTVNVDAGSMRVLVVGPAKAPVAGARVFLRGGGELGVTDDTGTLLTTLSPGFFAVSVVREGFAPRVLEGSVIAGQTVELRCELLPVLEELADVTVRAPHVAGGLAQTQQERLKSAKVVDVLGAEQMQKSGDSDAAAALRRVTGLTVVGGKYVFVRGLGDRYSSTLVNGMVLPSPEPEKRVIPLDLFPASLLESLLIQKTWSPDLPGEFGGGSVQLRTRQGSDDLLAQIGISTNLVLGTTFLDAPTYRGGNLDFLGFDDGTRALPQAVQAASDDQPLAEGNALVGGGYSKAELEDLGEQMPRIYSTNSQLVLPGLAMNGALGGALDTPLGRVGAIGAATWSQDFFHVREQRQILTVTGDDLQTSERYRTDGLDRSVALGGTLALSLVPHEGHRLRSVTLLNRTADDEARNVDGFLQEIGSDVRLTRLRYVERTLLVQQLLGEHALAWAPLGDDVSLRWRYGGALALRGEPDNRSTRYDGVDGTETYRLSDRPEGNQRLYSSMFDHSHDAGVSFVLPFSQWQGFFSSIELGAATMLRFREVDPRRFSFLAKGPLATAPATRQLGPERVFDKPFIDEQGFQLAEVTRNTDNYSGSALVGSTYALLDLPLTETLAFFGGGRFEWGKTAVETFELFNASAAPVVAELTTLDVLPSLSLAWSVLSDVKIRLAGARSIIRPELRELSPAVYTDVSGGRTRFGNPELSATQLTHLDLRAEWYLSSNETASFAVFGKHFDKPIESVVTAGADQAVTYDNVQAAWNAGVEVEGRVSLARVHEVLRGFFVGGNGALIFSRVEVGEEQRGILTSTKRPLEGQSPWVLNAQCGYDDAAVGSSIAVLYNVFGPRIVEVGALGLPDLYEQPFHQLDVVVRQNLPWGLQLSLRAQNLVDLPSTRTLRDDVAYSISRGRALSAGLSWRL